MSILASVLLLLLTIVSLPMAVAVIVFALQVFLAALPARLPRQADLSVNGQRPPVVVLVPAHDEASGIARTLVQVKSQLRAGDRILVVADNCSDDTATIASACGAEVAERSNETLRGKGFALAHGIDVLRDAPPEFVVILDADCDASAGSIDALVWCVMTTSRPAQALYLMRAPPAGSLANRLAEFAWRVRNLVRPKGWHRIGMPCQLMGTGMAFRWEMLCDAPLANASIVEDMKLGIDLAAGGKAPIFCPEALVVSMFPETAAATRSQRTRWEHGHLETILREVPRLLSRALVRRDPRLLGLALDLCVPPLALLGSLLLCICLISIAVALATGRAGPIFVNGVLLCGFVVAAFTAWLFQGRDLISLRELMSIPAYMLAKVPIYAAFLVRRQKSWVRTDRDQR